MNAGEQEGVGERDGAGLRWLFLDLNSYFASVEQQERPALRGRPMMVVPVASEGTCAIAASYEAKALGIRTGTPVWEARRLCPGIPMVPARHDVYVDYHHRILAEIDRHVPITLVCSIDEVACRLMDNEASPPERAVDLARRVKRGIVERVGECLQSSVGLAPGRLLAKIASDMQKPDGLTLLRADELPGRILDLKLTDLPGIGANMERRLQAHGIRSVAALWHLSPRQARTAWGSIEGERFWYALHGIDPPDRPPGPRQSVGHSHVLAPELRPPEQARLVARRLVMKAAGRLRRGEKGRPPGGDMARSLHLSVRLEHGPRWSGERRFSPTADSFALLAALDLLWQQMLRDQGRGGGLRCRKVSIVLGGLRQAEALPDLFNWTPGQMENPRGLALSRTLDGLNQRFGRDAVTIGPRPGGLPEYTGAKVAFSRIPDVEEFRE